MSGDNERIYLSPPHMSDQEWPFLQDAFESNWIAPLGPQVDAFERELAELVDTSGAVALSSGTAALHLALAALDVGPGDDVLVSDFTFAGSVFPITYVGARPVFVDCEERSWNMDPSLLAEALTAASRRGKLPRAVVVVHIYGQMADMERITAVCRDFDMPVIEDAAEALGATHGGRPAGSLGLIGVLSFNGNKIITTSGGGAVVSNDPELLKRIRKLSTQARDEVPHYEHSEIGYNYRMSNLLAAVGRGQLRVLSDRSSARRATFRRYQESLGDICGLDFMPQAEWGEWNGWLTCLTLDADRWAAGPEEVRLALESRTIEARRLWKPMHLQPVFANLPIYGGSVSERLFHRGLCLPSGSALTADQVGRVARIVRETLEGG